MTVLVWGVKASLLAYLRGLADSEIELAGVTESVDGFAFPGTPGRGDGVHRFTGAVTLTGHGGMLRLVFSDPHLDPVDDAWLLTLADPDDPSQRFAFARIAALEPYVRGGLRGRGTTLTGAGADLFFGPYNEGTPLDDPVVQEE